MARKSPESIRRYSLQAAATTCTARVKCLVVACNTGVGQSRSMRSRHEFAPAPVLGCSSPVRSPPAAQRAPARIVIATESTVRGGAYEAAIRLSGRRRS